ncbi:hypothetical protein HanRHA438_Chr14g0648881 [Helianthus annuus]|nr:hypothetical protein HanHA300_Chr14g0519931 [Helianthus annuus]KAJ0468107.1 hypothetical protein HanIR_Chr14g0692761 [Helianthus annuus]KAJ0485329.1 hypothetical protein HanHA89_Chr14g0566961 [Helianthus annuus]KAJ0655873.1 hypothetical protein HanLR1_Chr14g0529231 [Helianthus annuus]KAJ0659555.1 hypothetical protein HanOQP8_Chr14g0527411 [Helianthus annuus]
MNRHCSTNDPQATRHHCSTPCCFNPHYSGSVPPVHCNRPPLSYLCPTPIHRNCPTLFYRRPQLQPPPPFTVL